MDNTTEGAAAQPLPQGEGVISWRGFAQALPLWVWLLGAYVLYRVVKAAHK